MADDLDARLTKAGPGPTPSPDGGDGAGDDYLERRTLRRGSAGWLLLTGLGVAYVVSGDFSGWNVGLSKGGFGGLAIATVLMGAMYACLVFSSPNSPPSCPPRAAATASPGARWAPGAASSPVPPSSSSTSSPRPRSSSSSATTSNPSACSDSPPAGPSTSAAS